MKDYGDLPRDELVRRANRALSQYPEGSAEVHFKFTCEKCGERCTFTEPNQTFDEGECAVCGHMTPFEKGGFMLKLTIGGSPP